MAGSGREERERKRERVVNHKEKKKKLVLFISCKLNISELLFSSFFCKVISIRHLLVANVLRPSTGLELRDWESQN